MNSHVHGRHGGVVVDGWGRLAGGRGGVVVVVHGAPGRTRDLQPEPRHDETGQNYSGNSHYPNFYILGKGVNADSL